MMDIDSEDLLDAERIRQGMTPAARAKLTNVTLLPETDSTNSAVMRLPAVSQHAHVILAERQTSGRGRRQKTWHSPGGGNIYLSLGWRFHDKSKPLSTLPLVVAVAVCRALSRVGLQGHGIKWPNDILVDSKKLAGILVELRSTGSGPALAVIGIGLNVSMTDNAEDKLTSVIDRPWTDLDSVLNSGKQGCNRNQVSAMLLDELLLALAQFESEGFPAFSEFWQNLDFLHGKQIKVDRGGERISGEACGVNETGALLLKTNASGIQVFHSGEVSIQFD